MNKEKEIMYCKDCMWYDTEGEWSFGNKHMCIFHDLLCSPDDFCSWAEKDEEGKEEEDD